MSDCALALDAGGTGTTAWVATSDGTILGAGRGGPGNHVLGSMEVVRDSFATAVDAALHASHRSRDAVCSVMAGCAGIEATGETRGPIERLLRDLLPEAKAVNAVGDMVTAFHGALPDGVGAVVCAGTGAVGYGEDGEGQVWQADGWGHIFGDDGSAYAIGRAALRAAAQGLDGRGEPTLLVVRLPEALEVDSLPAAAYAIYGVSQPRERIAALAPTVAATAAEGDAAAVRILAEAGQALARTAAAVLRRLDLVGRTAPVATAGSVFKAGRLITDAFAEELRRRAPGCPLVPAALPPVGGAAKLAWRAVGVAWDASAVARAQEFQFG